MKKGQIHNYLPFLVVFLAFRFTYAIMRLPMKKTMSVRENWIAAFELLTEKPVVFLPFFVIAFFEGLALEIILFATRHPLSVLFTPVIRKFFGEQFLHYPFNLLVVPRMFYAFQLVIYVVLGAFLGMISVIMVKNVLTRLPLKANAIVKNALKRYGAVVIYGLVIVGAMFVIQRFDTFLVTRVVRRIARDIPQHAPTLYSFLYTIAVFVSNVIVQTFLIFTVPLLIVKDMPIWRALGGSIVRGAKWFLHIFPLLFVPLLVYLPVLLLKAFASAIVDKTFPEMTVIITVISILIAAVIECFIITSATQYLIVREKAS